jgi:hypothetical protein
MSEQELITEIADYLWDGQSNNRALREDIAVCIARIRQQMGREFLDLFQDNRLYWTYEIRDKAKEVCKLEASDE